MTNNNAISGGQTLVRHASIYALGNILRRAVGFLMLPVYTRYLTPADYGVIGLMIFAISLVEAFFGTRLHPAIMKYYFEFKEERQRDLLISTAFTITGVVTSVVTIFLIIFRKPASQAIFGTSDYASILGFFSVQIVMQPLEYYALLYLRLQHRPWFFIGINFTKLILQLSLNIWLVVFERMGVMGVAVSAMISSSIFALFCTAYTFSKVGWGFDRSLAVKMMRFSWPLWVAGFAGIYIGCINRDYLRIFGSLVDVGLFELSSKFGEIMGGLIWEPFSLYWQVERYKLYHQGNPKLIFQAVFSFISAILILAGLGIAIFSGPVIRIMADKEFYLAYKAVPFLVLGIVFYSFALFFNFGFEVKEKTGWISGIVYLTAAIITILYFILIPQFGFVGAAIAFMIAEAAQFLIVYGTSRRFYDMGINLTPLVWTLIVSAFAYWVTNGIIVRERLIEDIAFKSLVYVIAGIFIIYPIWQKSEVRLIFNEIAKSFGIKYNKN